MIIRKSISLAIGKEVEPIWNRKNIMFAIKVKPNTMLSLFKNIVADDQSIYELEEIILITKFKKETEVPIRKVLLNNDGSYRFYVKEGIEIKRSELFLPRYRKKKQDQ